MPEASISAHLTLEDLQVAIPRIMRMHDKTQRVCGVRVLETLIDCAMAPPSLGPGRPWAACDRGVISTE